MLCALICTTLKFFETSENCVSSVWERVGILRKLSSLLKSSLSQDEKEKKCSLSLLNLSYQKFDALTIGTKLFQTVNLTSRTDWNSYDTISMVLRTCTAEALCAYFFKENKSLSFGKIQRSDVK